MPWVKMYVKGKRGSYKGLGSLLRADADAADRSDRRRAAFLTDRRWVRLRTVSVHAALPSEGGSAASSVPLALKMQGPVAFLLFQL